MSISGEPQGPWRISSGSISAGDLTVETGEIDIDLAGCGAKIDRAYEHLEQLQPEIRAFFDSDPYGALGEMEGDGRWYVFRLEEIRQPPPRIGVLIGEFVHQLRSTLDHLCYGLNRHFLGREPREDVPFPIDLPFPVASGRAKWTDKKKRGIKNLPTEWQTLIEWMQPYQDSPIGESLGLIEWIWNEDKHKTVRPLPLGTAMLYPMRFTPNADAGPVLEDRPRTGIALKQGAEIARVRISPNGPDPKVKMEALLGVLIQLEEPGRGWSTDRNILLDLERAATIISSLIACFPSAPTIHARRVNFRTLNYARIRT